MLLAGALAPLAVQADVVFSNVTSTSDVNNASTVCGGSPSIPCELFFGVSDAEAFTPAADFTLTDAQVLVFDAPTQSGDPDFNVFL
jgi:hypothetical protein